MTVESRGKTKWTGAWPFLALSLIAPLAYRFWGFVLRQIEERV